MHSHVTLGATWYLENVRGSAKRVARRQGVSDGDVDELLDELERRLAKSIWATPIDGDRPDAAEVATYRSRTILRCLIADYHRQHSGRSSSRSANDHFPLLAREDESIRDPATREELSALRAALERAVDRTSQAYARDDGEQIRLYDVLLLEELERGETNMSAIGRKARSICMRFFGPDCAVAGKRDDFACQRKGSLLERAIGQLPRSLRDVPGGRG